VTGLAIALQLRPIRSCAIYQRALELAEQRFLEQRLRELNR
jgi:hypothetical protein